MLSRLFMALRAGLLMLIQVAIEQIINWEVEILPEADSITHGPGWF